MGGIIHKKIEGERFSWLVRPRNKNMAVTVLTWIPKVSLTVPEEYNLRFFILCRTKMAAVLSESIRASIIHRILSSWSFWSTNKHAFCKPSSEITLGWPVSMLGHSGLTLILFLPVRSSHFTISKISYFVQCPKRQGGVNNSYYFTIYQFSMWKTQVIKQLRHRPSKNALAAHWNNQHSSGPPCTHLSED